MNELTITITVSEVERQAIAKEARRRSLVIATGLDIAQPLDAVIGKLELACQIGEHT